MMLKRSACRSCKQPIVWARAEGSDRWMPMNAEPDANGTHVLMGWDDPPVATKVGAGELAFSEVRERYTSHFATCPNANDHRKPRTS
jgi:hypothetical protein